jgi:uncharacterized OsmC-like protein
MLLAMAVAIQVAAVGQANQKRLSPLSLAAAAVMTAAAMTVMTAATIVGATQARVQVQVRAHKVQGRVREAPVFLGLEKL